jgi:hypothetical protein
MQNPFLALNVPSNITYSCSSPFVTSKTWLSCYQGPATDSCPDPDECSTRCHRPVKTQEHYLFSSDFLVRNLYAFPICSIHARTRNSSVGIRRDTVKTARGRFPAMASDFSHLDSIQIGFGPYPLSYPITYRSLFPRSQSGRGMN